MRKKTVIDAEGLILGRMASTVAKRLLEGERIEIVNAESVVVSGNRLRKIKEDKDFLDIGGHGKGPTHYRTPHMMVRRTIRGMLPHRKHKGKKAYKRLRVHTGVPRELEGMERETISDAHKDRLGRRYVTIGEIAENIGWRRM